MPAPDFLSALFQLKQPNAGNGLIEGDVIEDVAADPRGPINAGVPTLTPPVSGTGMGTGMGTAVPSTAPIAGTPASTPPPQMPTYRPPEQLPYPTRPTRYQGEYADLYQKLAQPLKANKLGTALATALGGLQGWSASSGRPSALPWEAVGKNLGNLRYGRGQLMERQMLQQRLPILKEMMEAEQKQYTDEVGRVDKVNKQNLDLANSEFTNRVRELTAPAEISQRHYGGLAFAKQAGVNTPPTTERGEVVTNDASYKVLKERARLAGVELPEPVTKHGTGEFGKQAIQVLPTDAVTAVNTAFNRLQTSLNRPDVAAARAELSKEDPEFVNKTLSEQLAASSQRAQQIEQANKEKLKKTPSGNSRVAKPPSPEKEKAKADKLRVQAIDAVYNDIVATVRPRGGRPFNAISDEFKATKKMDITDYLRQEMERRKVPADDIPDAVNAVITKLTTNFK